MNDGFHFVFVIGVEHHWTHSNYYRELLGGEVVKGNFNIYQNKFLEAIFKYDSVKTI